MKCVLHALVGAFLGQFALAGATNPPITKIVFRRISPQISPDSFGAKPTTIYIAGETFYRIEQSPDPEHGNHRLFIINEPDAWMINLFEHSGQHMVDPGPTFAVHHCILDKKDSPREFVTLEYGKENAFFRSRNAFSLGTRDVEQQRCEASEFKHGSYRMVLYTTAESHTPYQLEIFKDGKPELAVRYISYQTKLPFDSSLFKPPTDIKISEARQK